MAKRPWIIFSIKGNKMKKLLITVGVFGAIIAGCSSEITNDVNYYKENPEERAAKIKECLQNPGELEHTPNCENAIAAQTQIEFSSDNKSMPGIR